VLPSSCRLQPAKRFDLPKTISYGPDSFIYKSRDLTKKPRFRKKSLKTSISPSYPGAKIGVLRPPTAPASPPCFKIMAGMDHRNSKRRPDRQGTPSGYLRAGTRHSTRPPDRFFENVQVPSPNAKRSSIAQRNLRLASATFADDE